MRRHERGIALPTALFLSVILILFVTAATRYTLGIMSNLEKSRARVTALNVAEGGAEWAIAQFDPANLGAIATTATFAGGTYVITVSTATTSRYAIRAAAYVPNATHPLSTRSIEVVVAPGTNPAGNFALASIGDISLSGNVSIDSAPSGHGDVHTNHNLYVNGNPTVNGAISASGQAVAPSAYAAQSHSPVMTIPTMGNSAIDADANLAKANGIQNIGAFNGSTLSGYYQSYAGYNIHSSGNTNGGTISVGGNTTITVTGTVFIEGGLSLSGNVQFVGGGTIVCTEGISISGNVTVGAAGHPINLVSLAAQSPISLSGNPAITGALFAPNGGISASGNVSVLGTMIAGGGIGLSGNVGVTRDTTQNMNWLASTYWKTLSYREF
jgi:hypothetical protein